MQPNKPDRFSPTLDPSSPTGVFIPTNLEGAIIEFNRMLPVSLKIQLDQNFISNDYLDLGKWLTDNWQLRNQTFLVHHLINLGANSHPDNLSKLLLEIYISYLRNPFFDMEKDLIEADFFERISKTFSQLMSCDRATLWIMDAVKVELVTKIPLSGKTADIRISPEVGLIGTVFDLAETVNIPFDLYDYSDIEDIKKIKQLDIKTAYRHCSILMSPIQTQDNRILGIIQLINKQKSGVFTPYEPKIYPQAPECWQASFTEADQIFVERLNSQLSVFLEV